MGMPDANSRINLAAPLLSVRLRRHGGAETAPTGTGLPACYKAGAATSSEPPGRTTSAVPVPFVWERRPGHPKSVRTRRQPPPPPLTIVDEPSPATRRSDDTLSRDDAASCVTANCSATGLSDAASAGAGTGSSEPRARARGGAMMDRFLPAAHAVAAGSPQNAFRRRKDARTAAAGDRRLYLLPAQRRVPLHHIAACHLPPAVPPAPSSPRGKNGDYDGATSDAPSTAGFASRRCGLLSVRCVRSALRRRAGRPFRSNGGGRSPREKKPLLPHTGDDHGMQCWEEVYIKSLLRSGRGSLMGPAAAVASELDRTVCELYSRRRDGQAVRPKASHLGLLLVLDRSNEACGHSASPPARKFSITGGDTALLLRGGATTKGSLPSGGEKRLGRDDAAADAGGGGYGFPLLLDDKEGGSAGRREMALSSPQPLLPLPLPKSPTESWLARALPSVSTRPPTTSFLGLHVKHAPLPWCSIDSSRDVHHDRQRQIRVHDLQK